METTELGSRAKSAKIPVGFPDITICNFSIVFKKCKSFRHRDPLFVNSFFLWFHFDKSFPVFGQGCGVVYWNDLCQQLGENKRLFGSMLEKNHTS